jgi:hypothetical protein
MRLVLDREADFVGDGLNLPLVGAVADDEIVRELGNAGEIQNLYIARFLGFRGADGDEPGGDTDFVRWDFARMNWLRVRLSQNTLLWVSYYRRGLVTGTISRAMAYSGVIGLVSVPTRKVCVGVALAGGVTR